jgi:hypothetical protein
MSRVSRGFNGSSSQLSGRLNLLAESFDASPASLAILDYVNSRDVRSLLCGCLKPKVLMRPIHFERQIYLL